jgi:hypothetical protein
MYSAATLSARADHRDASTPLRQDATPVAEQFVGEHPTTEAGLSDEGREAAIKRAGYALIAAKGRAEASRRRYAESSCLTDKADEDAANSDARRALELMTALIRGRSAAQVKRMEQERGLT